VGVGVGVPGFLALVGLAFFLWKRTQKKKINRVEMPANDMRGAYERPLYQSPGSPLPQKATEVQQKYYISEMDGAGAPVEMPGNESRR
jgi:hypothetical protein